MIQTHIYRNPILYGIRFFLGFFSFSFFFPFFPSTASTPFRMNSGMHVASHLALPPRCHHAGVTLRIGTPLSGKPNAANRVPVSRHTCRPSLAHEAHMPAPSYRMMCLFQRVLFWWPCLSTVWPRLVVFDWCLPLFPWLPHPPWVPLWLIPLFHWSWAKNSPGKPTIALGPPLFSCGSKAKAVPISW